MIETLSSLKGFANPLADLEQYMTQPEIAADWLSEHADDFVDKHVLDLGCGTGMLGIAAGLLGAKKVTFLDMDKQALDICKQNATEHLDIDCEFIHSPLKSIPADVVVMNPPFGTKHRHADRQFIIAACMSAPIVHSMHLEGSEEFVAEIASSSGHILTNHRTFAFTIENTMRMHTELEKHI